jgi:hypothetical protein
MGRLLRAFVFSLMMTSGLGLTLWSSTSRAAIPQEANSQSLQTRKFTPAISNDGCKLLSFSLANYRSTTRGSDGTTTSASRMGAYYRTNSVECLKKFGVVQFIEGCAFDSDFNLRTQEENHYFGHVRDLRGETIYFQHVKQEVDTVDIDPLYSSPSPGDDEFPEGRHAFYAVPHTPLSGKNTPTSLSHDASIFFDSDRFDVWADRRNREPLLFVRDLPILGMYMPNPYREHAVNASLEFQTCIYRIQDVPLTGDPKFPGTPTSAGGPIQCFSWRHSAIFDHHKKEFKSIAGIHPFCSVPREKAPATE